MSKGKANHLEDISRTMVQAVNGRDFSPESEMWSHMSNRFRGDLEQYRALGKTHAKVGPTELEEHFDTFRKIIKDYPEYPQKDPPAGDAS
ncbi:hypothetical protein CLAFUW4_14794 [Fulvia fulva]|uniref:Uncharacterized protein n=1 Tax=Passalora fulva TaxID=5499 RepID=A0A9Q8PLW4_PASFU|nr:uncharacterized protein CLAFUR5_14619 [Fulvia fulva]KAK4609094.1 hypothetical protein CLAFUR4_14786 [Fulvia fulva]KAK4609820.1 hypothetical protein CLAFUR0_14786 [Fulvia fulva]UJO24936.1 hypothetical protein CLAFUR5_14619 [Fulvia fulva]WPV22923.1 hypothetical protein CLAFUW4_14794 [Fulvia fulva]WPV37822.1 hypothetical protein CLAFUW7_14795 [Fulvia fulva]